MSILGHMVTLITSPHSAYAYYDIYGGYVVMLGRRREAGFMSNMPSSRYAFLLSHSDTHTN